MIPLTLEKNMKKVLFVLVSIFVTATTTNTLKAEPETALLSGVNFDAQFYAPQGTAKKLGILVLGGAEGGLPIRQAESLAKEGFPTLALGYFKTKRTPKFLDMIPLEYFDQPIEWLMKNENVKGKGIVVIGGSKGGELALLLASRKPEIKGVVAFVPSSVVFQGIPEVFWPPKSSWSFKGESVPFVPYDTSKGIDPNNLLGLYQCSLQQKEYAQKAAIQVEKINGPLLFFSGMDDKLWPSTEMCEIMCRRLQEKGFAYKYEHIKYENAGHTLNEYFMLGGTKEGNKKASVDSTEKMLEFLNNLLDERNAPAGINKPRL
jgi:uncharacterized protein